MCPVVYISPLVKRKLLEKKKREEKMVFLVLSQLSELIFIHPFAIHNKKKNKKTKTMAHKTKDTLKDRKTAPKT